MKAFEDLPRPLTSAHARRKCGVEIEFSGLSETETAEIVRDELGGTARRVADHVHEVGNTSIGRVVVELDTALKEYSDTPLVGSGLTAARNLIPVEIVTEPIDPALLGALEGVRERLRRAGALGSADGMLKGFGVHLNIEVVDPDDPFTRDTIIAYGLVEAWLRREMPIDVTRRVLPFVDPWPRALVDDLVAAEDLPLKGVRAIYAAHTQSRNHGLDLLPLFAAADKTGFDEDFPETRKTSARPAYHFRLPDCRIDQEDWRLALEWRRWLAVERVADTPELLNALRREWADHRDRLLAGDGDWTERVHRNLNNSGCLGQIA